MGDRLHVPVLAGGLVRVERLAMRHAGDLAMAADEDRSTYGFTRVPHGIAEVEQYIDTQTARAERGELIPFAQVRVADGRAVGTTSYTSIRFEAGKADPFAVEIGWTWLSASAQRTGINTESKLLLMTHAFTAWRVIRIDLETDDRNHRSRRAIEGLGARFEGVLRSWQPSLAAGEEGLFRDSAIFSVLASEWRATEGRLRRRLQ